MLSGLEISPEVLYLSLLFSLFVVPRLLQRYGIPTGITSFALGALSGTVLGLFRDDTAVSLLSTFGIVSLFLLAGIDIDLRDLRRERRVLSMHVASQLALLAGAAWGLAHVLGLQPRAAILTALALLTSSAGFILDSLAGFRGSDRERFWVRSKVISAEIVALLVLFFTLQSATWEGLGVSSLTLVLMIAVLPVVFRGFARFVAPYAPKSEFAFLLMTAVLCAFVTRKLGVYYLVGAFVVGMAAQRFREKLPAMTSEKMLSAVEAFSSIFVPFYFFSAGLQLRQEDFGLSALLAGAVLVLVFVPLRMAVVALHIRLNVRETFRESLRINLQMLPTLVITLVIAQILRERFVIPGYLFGGLIVYTVVTTILPGFWLRSTGGGGGIDPTSGERLVLAPLLGATPAEARELEPSAAAPERASL